MIIVKSVVNLFHTFIIANSNLASNWLTTETQLINQETHNHETFPSIRKRKKDGKGIIP